MKKHKTALQFYNQMEQILIHYGNDDTKRKIEFVKNFLKENFQIEDIKNSYIDFNRVDTKSVLFLFVSLLIKYQNMNQNPKEQFTKYYGFEDSTINKMKRALEKMRKLKKIKKDAYYLEVEAIIPMEERTVEETQFIEEYLDKIHIDIEYDEDIILSTNELISIITGIMRDYDTYRQRKI
jgi:hypothetical protein